MAEIRVSDAVLRRLEALAEKQNTSVEAILEQQFADTADAIPDLMRAESFEHLQLATEAAQLGIWVLDVRSGHLEWNEQHLRMYGITRDNFTNEITSWRKTLHPEDKAYAEAEFERVLNGDSVQNVNFRIVRPDGEIRYINGAATPVFDDDGNIIKVIGNNIDITDIRQTHETLLNQQQILATISEAIIVIDTDYKIMSWNQPAVEMYGWQADEVIGRDMQAVTQSSYPDTDSEAVVRAFLEKGYWKGEAIQKTKSGVQIHVLASVNTLRDTDGNPIAYVGVNRDITARKRAEVLQAEHQALNMRLQKEKEITHLRSHMLRTIVHEFRTPLSVILTSVGMIVRRGHQLDDDQKHGQLAKVNKQVALLDSFLEDMKVFATVDQNFFNPQMETVDFIAFCAGLADDMRMILKPEQILETIFSTETLSLICDRRLIHLAISNLLTNASKYSPAGSRIELRVVMQDESVIVTVSDEGIGIPEEEQEFLFIPFHRASNTTDYNGTGVGLSIVKEVVEKHNGTITCESAVNAGTTFMMTLPIKTD
ncbi:MAG: PAS domain S-box protein [Chloroflexota bacterium]